VKTSDCRWLSGAKTVILDHEYNSTVVVGSNSYRCYIGKGDIAYTLIGPKTFNLYRSEAGMVLLPDDLNLEDTIFLDYYSSVYAADILRKGITEPMYMIAYFVDRTIRNSIRKSMEL